MEPSDFVSIYCEMAEIVGVENTCKIFAPKPEKS